jgi:hypothetical protein
MTREEFLSRGAAFKAVFMLDAIEKAYLAKTKDVVATTDDRDTAEEMKQNLIDEAEAYDHVNTGRMENGFKVRKRGGEYEVTDVPYAKYVNGYDREAGGDGFIDAAAKQTIISTGDDVQLLV